MRTHVVSCIQAGLLCLVLLQPVALAGTVRDPRAPTVHVIVYGAPVFKQLRGTAFSRLQNTSGRIFRDDTNGMLYLELKRFWMSASSLSGHWSPEPNPPVEISRVDGRGSKDNVAEVDRELDAIRSTTAPKVIVTFRPRHHSESEGRSAVTGDVRLQSVK
jgi:hypothetical protein